MRLKGVFIKKRKLSFLKKLSFLLTLLIWTEVSVPINIQASSEPEITYLITYGADSDTSEGDDDFLQVIFIRVPDKEKSPLYLRIFDPDCGGKLDGRYWFRWTTNTRFRLFGGEGAYSNPGIKKPTPDESALSSGNLLADERFGENPSLDYQWYNFAKIRTEDGEKIVINEKIYRYFKLVVQGENGKDGNVFGVAATRSDTEHGNTVSDPDIETFTFAPTVHLTNKNLFAEIRFAIPDNAHEILVNNFDLAKARLFVDTPFRADLPVISSGQNEWLKDVIKLDKSEYSTIGGIRFEGGEEFPNDATFYITDAKGEPLLIQLPVRIFNKPNLRPEIHAVIQQQQPEDCHIFKFDASESADPDGDSLVVEWDFGDGTKSGVQGLPAILHRYEKTGRYKVRLVVSDTSGQVSSSDFQEFTVKVNQPPIAEAGEHQIGATDEKLLFDASGSSDSDGKIISYLWDFGDKSDPEKGKKIHHSFKEPGKYTVTLQIEDNSASPCSIAKDTCEVLINGAPVANISVFLADKKNTASAGENIRFSGIESTDKDGKIISYEWNMGDGTVKTGEEITHAYEKPGKYKVTLKVTDDSGTLNGTNETSTEIIVNYPPVAEFMFHSQASVNETIQFDGSVSQDKDGKIIEFKWDFGDGTESAENQGKASHSYGKPGKYQVTLTVKDDSGSSSDTDKKEGVIIINDPPVANAGDDQWISRSQVQFDGSGSVDRDCEITKFSWDFGDGETKTGKSPIHTFRSPGIYTVRLTVTDNSETSTNQATDEMTVTVNNLPIADAGPDRIGSPGQSLIFDASGSIDPDGEIVKAVWNFGDESAPETGINVSHTYTNSGKYNVLLTVYDNSGHEGAVSFDETTVIINKPPVPVARVYNSKGILYNKKTFLTDKIEENMSVIVIAPGDEIRFDGTRSYDPDGKISLFQWDIFGNVKSETQGMTPDDSDKLNLKPIAGFKTPDSIFRFSAPGIYTAVLTAIDNSHAENSASNDRVFIRVNSPPAADAGKNIHTNQKNVFLDGSASTDADGDPLIYTWDFGDGSPKGKGEKVFHTYDKRGNYPVILTVDDRTGMSNSQAAASITVKIDDSPVADAGGDRIVCAGKAVLFDGSGSVDPEGGLMKYHWDFGDGTTAQGINPAKTYTKGGAYPVSLNVTDDSGLDGNSGTDQIVVKVIESPVADAGSDQRACAGAVVQFDGTKSKNPEGIISSFLWDFGDGITGGGPTPVHVYTKTGIYRVRLTVAGTRTDNTCSYTDDDEMTVTIQQSPVVEMIFPDITEMGKQVNFIAGQDIGRRTQDTERRTQESEADSIHQLTAIEWDFGDGIREKGKEVSHIFPKSGNYIVTLTVTADSNTDCNKTSIQKKITINAPPVAKAGEDYFVGVNQTVIFNGSGSYDPDGAISSFTWDFGDGSSGTGIRVKHQYQTAGRYVVVLQVKDSTELANNSANDNLVVTVNEAPAPVIGIQVEGKNLKFSGSSSALADLNQQEPTQTITVCPGEEIIFDGTGSFDTDGEIINYIWSLGDGSPLIREKKTSHRYHSPGTYLVTLETDDGRSVSNSRVQSSVVIIVNNMPVVDAGAENCTISPDDKLMFDASDSTDYDGNIISFQWDFGDGTLADGKKASHQFKKSGNYQVRLIVKDDSESGCSSAEEIVMIRVNAPPVAKIIVKDSGKKDK